MTTATTNLFDRHLDICAQCRDHPFDLCPGGRVALEIAVIGATTKASFEAFMEARKKEKGEVRECSEHSPK